MNKDKLYLNRIWICWRALMQYTEKGTVLNTVLLLFTPIDLNFFD